MLGEREFANYPITINPTFEVVYIYVHSAVGFIAISLSCFVIFLICCKSRFLGKEYMYCLLTLKLFSHLFDVNNTIIYLPFVLLPCKGVYSMGLGPLIGISAHVGTVICVTALSGICAWFNCCLFHRHQMIMPYDNPLKLSDRSSLIVYSIMNVVMFVNPIVFFFSSADDHVEQAPIVENSTMFWLLHKPSYKIWTDDNTPAMMRFHFPYTMLTFALCTLTTTVLTRHSIRVMKSRSDSISAATIAMQERLINSLSIQMNIQSLGVSGPVIIWLVCLCANLIAPEISAGAFVLMLFTSIANSVYMITSTKKYRRIVVQYFHSIFGGFKDSSTDSPALAHRPSVVPRPSISQQFTVVIPSPVAQRRQHAVH